MRVRYRQIRHRLGRYDWIDVATWLFVAAWFSFVIWMIITLPGQSSNEGPVDEGPTTTTIYRETIDDERILVYNGHDLHCFYYNNTTVCDFDRYYRENPPQEQR